MLRRFCLARLASVLSDLVDLDEARQRLAEAEDGEEPRGVLDAARVHLARARGTDPAPHLRALREVTRGPGHVRDAHIALHLLGG